MARTTQEIYNLLIQNKTTVGLPVNNNQLDFLNIMLYPFAFGISAYESILDIFKLDIISLTAQAAYGSKAWLRSIVLLWQYDSNDAQVIQFNTTTFKYFYPVVDESKRIIKAISIKAKNNRTALLKVAKKPSTSLVVLETDEINSLRNYLTTICPAGQNIEIRSVAGDNIIINLTVLYNGQFVQTLVKTAVETAITSFLNSLEFDGIVYLNDIIDVAQGVDGVIDPTISSSSTSNFLNYSNYTTIINNVETYSGYFANITINTTMVPQN